MELDKMIKDLIESEIGKNQALGITLLFSKRVDDDTRRKYLDEFVKDYISGKFNLTESENVVLEKWVELYQTMEVDSIKKRVKKIE